MECNKVEATRAKRIAEKRMQSKDFLGARKLLLKAQLLYPGLENVSQMLTICEVHASFQLNVAGSQMDWYGILQLPNTADESAIEEQYHKLAFLLNPGKNRFPGAEAAFSLVKEAYGVLSEPAKRSLYDGKRIASSQDVNSWAQEQVHIGNNFKNSSTSQHQGLSKPQQRQSRIPQTFWTKCLLCDTTHLYNRVCLYRRIRCKNCLQYFVAYDMNYIGPTEANLGYTRTGTEVAGSCQRKVLENEASRRAKIKEKRVEMNKRAEGGRSQGNVVSKRRKVAVDSSESCDGDSTDVENEATTEYDVATQGDRATCSRYPLRSMLKKDVTYNRNGSGCDDFSKSLEYERSKRGLSSDGTDHQGNGEFPNGTVTVFAANPETQSTPDPNVYPDPEFHDFDKDRAQEHFRVGQIWAVYDDSDVLPRFYVLIRKTYSHESKVTIAWLEPNPEDQYGLDWLKEELPLACGNFKIGYTEDTENLLMFSHLASWQKGEVRGTYNIYPREGDVWALFNHWSIEWSYNPDRHRKFEYEFVEVLSDYVEGTGVVVAYLVMVEGFTSLFERMENMEKNHFLIPSSELLRFSHRVPSYRMTKYLELDPASVYSKDFSPKGIDNVLSRSVHIQSNSSCSKSRVKMDTKAVAPKMLTSSMKNSKLYESIQKKENLDDGRCSLGEMNGAHRKDLWQANASQHEAEEGKRLLGGPGSLDVLPSKKPETASMTRPNCNSQGNNSSSLASLKQVPGIVFHSFKSEKSADKFQEGQIWALYGGDNGSLPIIYVQIKKVESPEFKVHATRLEPCPSFEKDILWSKKGLPFGCGLFKPRTGKPEIFERVFTFSHQVRVVSLPENDRYYIWPWTGEVWAVYKNWSTEWTPCDMKHCEHELVEVLHFDSSVYKVLVLEAVNGFKNIYKGTGVTVDIMWHELLRFSHCVPSLQLTEERGGTLVGYLELDPAALPDNPKQDKVDEENASEQRGSVHQHGGSAPVKPVIISNTTRQEFNQIFEWPTASPCMRGNCITSPAGGQRASEGQEGGSAPLKQMETSCRTEQAEFHQIFEWPTSPSTRHNGGLSLAGERRASEEQQGESMLMKLEGMSYRTREEELNRVLEWPTSPPIRCSYAVSPILDITNLSTALSRAFSPEVAKDLQSFAEWAHQGFLEVGCPAEPAELEGVGDEYGRAWVQRYPKLFALFKPQPHYGTIMGVSDCYLGLIRSSLWGTFANFVKEVAHVDWRISDSKIPNLVDQLKALEEAGFPIIILKNHLKALTFQAQQRAIVARATFEALETAKAAVPSTECLEDEASAADMEVLKIKGVLAEARRKRKAAKAKLLELREQKATMEKEIELARRELEAAEAHSLLKFCDYSNFSLPLPNVPDSKPSL
ncbi:hypothetical protein MRB53_010770 [Persea americana]|uniref:Uncharacterized protein n=1 Tax=Persea americana TaxID=3435 RepID=A0ACC2LT32_PERAE|nr:hypothetical protein MRB53_010770 [Persea americana]